MIIVLWSHFDLFWYALFGIAHVLRHCDIPSPDQQRQITLEKQYGTSQEILARLKLECVYNIFGHILAMGDLFTRTIAEKWRMQIKDPCFVFNLKHRKPVTGELIFSHDDVIKWKHFPRNWPFVRGIHRSRWIPHTKASDAELWCFLWSASE